MNAGNVMRALTMSTMDSLETVFPFWAVNRQCAHMTVIVVMEEPVSADRARNAQPILTAAVVVLVITDSAGLHVKRTQTAAAVLRVICANTPIACAEEANAKQYIWMVYSTAMALTLCTCSD